MAYLAEGIQVHSTYKVDKLWLCSVRVGEGNYWKYKATLEGARKCFEEWVYIITRLNQHNL